MALYQLQSVSGNLFLLIVLQPKMLQAAYAMKLNYYIERAGINLKYGPSLRSDIKPYH